MDERRILIVDHQQELGLNIAAALRQAGFQTALASSAAEALRELENRTPNLVVLRAELPDQPGFSLCGAWKKRFSGQFPILLVSEAPRPGRRPCGPGRLHHRRLRRTR